MLTGNALTIDRASVDGRAVVPERRGDDAVFPLPRPLGRGRRATLRVAYHGTPRRGLTFDGDSAYTTYSACDWMFCAQDRPGDKATLRLELTLPRGMRSIGSGSLTRTSQGARERHVWRETRPYPSYLFGFAAGRLRTAEGRAGRTRLVHASAVASPDELERVFADTAAALLFFEERAGVAFPHRAYAQLLVAGGEAQEAAAFSVLGAETMAPVLDGEEDWAVPHELAHQWWGNLVTCASWTDFWLNEGITVFMTAAWKEQRWGRAAYDRELALARERLAVAAAAGFDVPLDFAGTYPSLRIRRAVQYSKGALFMDRLRRELGDPAFWAALRRYTVEHSGRTVTTADFRRAFERSSGRDLSAAFAGWVE
ncbi:MAG: M1 family aminopeptidase [Vicinamibacteria bacterium]